MFWHSWSCHKLIDAFSDNILRVWKAVEAESAKLKVRITKSLKIRSQTYFQGRWNGADLGVDSNGRSGLGQLWYEHLQIRTRLASCWERRRKEQFRWRWKLCLVSGAISASYFSFSLEINEVNTAESRFESSKSMLRRQSLDSTKSDGTNSKSDRDARWKYQLKLKNPSVESKH